LQPELCELDDAATIDLAKRELAELLGARGEPILADVARHPRGMPQYTLGHMDHIRLIRESAARHAGLFLAGNAFEGVGIPDCIRSGQGAADAVLTALTAEGSIAAA
jgi:oxygen-dependent protoporphyrinogen oxidase